MRPSGARRAAALPALLLAAGCATSSHTVEPYRSDPEAAAELQAKAHQVCDEMDPEGDLPQKPFVSDGCSSWIDGSWVECCVEHDIPYWCGGTREARRGADRQLDACVSDMASGFLGGLMYLGVRVGGHPVFPAPWRWGFGRDYPAGYDEPLSEP